MHDGKFSGSTYSNSDTLRRMPPTNLEVFLELGLAAERHFGVFERVDHVIHLQAYGIIVSASAKHGGSGTDNAAFRTRSNVDGASLNEEPYSWHHCKSSAP